MTTRTAFACFLLAAIPGAAETIVSYTATTDNVANAHDSIRIELFRWSTDAERDQFLDAWNRTTAAPAAGRGRGGRGPGGGEAAAGGAPAGGAEAGRGAAGRGGRGGRGGAPAAPLTPEASLAAALHQAPTVGYLWSSEVAGYSIHCALRIPQEGGGERIILITDRRLGEWNDRWKPTGAEAQSGGAPNYDFSVIELHLNAKGEGEGKISFPAKIAADPAAKAIALENYGALPVVLRNVKRK